MSARIRRGARHGVGRAGRGALQSRPAARSWAATVLLAALLCSITPVVGSFAGTSRESGGGGAERSSRAGSAGTERAAVARSAGEPAAAGRSALLGTKAPVAPEDTYFDSEWDLWDAASTKRAGGYGVDAARAWTRTKGSRDVVVAVLDTGITDHPELRGAHLAPGYDFVSGDEGVDAGDGDGWDDDPTDPGDACEDDDQPASWHGTFVTGEIAARHDRTGVAGEAPGVTVEPVRVLGGCGGSEADTVAAIEWASGGTVPGVPANRRPARVVSLSLGASRGPCSDALQTAVADAVTRGTVVVAAAGNDGHAVADVSPANCAGVVSVVASTRSGRLAAYSTHGSAALAPSIAAPGGSSRDPILGAGWTSTTTQDAEGNAATISAEEGTSMAAPRVAAAVALLLSVRPATTPAQVASALARTATPFAAAAHCTLARCGPGIVDAGDLVGAAKRFVRVSSPRVRSDGARMTASPGRWRAAPADVGYQWLRDGRAIAGATTGAYRLRAADRGHVLAVRVRVTRPGSASAVATSAGKRVPV